MKGMLLPRSIIDQIPLLPILSYILNKNVIQISAYCHPHLIQKILII